MTQNTDKNPDGSKNTRREQRKRMLMGGRIVAEEGTSYIDCTILDASPSGAQIRVGSNRTIPSRFYLINVPERTAHAAKIVWRNADRAGLSFETTYPLSGTLPDNIGHLRKHWLECATR